MNLAIVTTDEPKNRQAPTQLAAQHHDKIRPPSHRVTITDPLPAPGSMALRQSWTLDDNAVDAIRQAGQLGTNTDEIEESFTGTVEELRSDEIRLRTISSAGEEGEAWLPISRIPMSEKKYLEVGAPVRIAIVISGKETRARESHIRVLRPNQWKSHPETVSAVASMILERMKKVLGSGG